MPALGLSLLLITSGAILAFAVEWSSSSVNIEVVGLILMAVGAFGAVMSALFLTSFAPFGHHDTRELY